MAERGIAPEAIAWSATCDSEAAPIPHSTVSRGACGSGLQGYLANTASNRGGTQ
jgi:hypothetical protein